MNSAFVAAKNATFAGCSTQIMKYSALLPLSFLLLSLTTGFAQKNYAFKNANWYNGKDFTTATWYTVDGKLTQKAPEKIDSTFDMTGHYMLPPLGDAYCTSMADNPLADKQAGFYVNEGVFYLQIIGNTQEGRKQLGTTVNSVNMPDALFSNGWITCTLGTPFLQYESQAQGIRNPTVIAQKSAEIKLQRKGHGDGYWFVDSKDALNRNWEKIKPQTPGVIAIYLLDAQKSGGKENKGLTPEVAKMVVKKAHKSDLKVFAHIENADDLRLALDLGIDGILNLPGSNWDGNGDTKAFEITDADLKKLVKKQMAIVPHFSQSQRLGMPKQQVQTFQVESLMRLVNAGANVVMGSDDTQRTIRTELNYWFQLGKVSYPAIIKILCDNTPRAIFPDRKVGRIEKGYEASFIVLDSDPFENLLKLRAIKMKVKKGVIIP